MSRASQFAGSQYDIGHNTMQYTTQALAIYFEPALSHSITTNLMFIVLQEYKQVPFILIQLVLLGYQIYSIIYFIVITDIIIIIAIII